MIGLMPILSSSVQQRRGTCVRCPYRVSQGIGGQVAIFLAQYLADERRDDPFLPSWCAQCRCYLPLKTRVSWAHCPLGYW